MLKKYIIIAFVFIFQIYTSFSEGTIIVLDASSKNPLKEASVRFVPLENKPKNTKTVRKTDNNGKVTNPYNDKTQVIITFIGYSNIIDTISNIDKTYYLSTKSIEMDEVIVTGNFKPMSAQKSVYDVKVISQAKIDNNSSNTLRDLLLTESNIRVDQDNVLGSSININGISGENIKIMVDGVPLIGRLNGNIDVSQINLNNIQRVEIIEGPMSSVYGSDALGGVINLISKEPNKEKTELNINTYYESVGSYKINGSANYSVSGFNILFSGGRDLFQGYDPTYKSRNIKWNPKEQYFVNLQTSYNFDNHTIRYQGAYFREYVLNRGELRAPYFESAFDDKYYTDRITNSIMYNGKLNKNMFVDVTTAYSYYHRVKNTFFKNMLDLSEKLTADPADQDTSDFKTLMFRPVFSHDKLFSNFNYQVGLDFNLDGAEGKKIKSQSQYMYDLAGFVSMQYEPVSTMIIQPSVRFIKNSIYNAPVIPAINFKYDINKNFTLRASYAKGFRAPSIKELFYLFVDINHNIYGNESLKAEKSDSYNASLNFKMSDNTYYFSVEPKVYYNSILDMITLAAISDVLYKNVNIGKYETVGTNLTLKYIRENTSTIVTASYIGRMNSIAEDSIGKATNAPRFNFSTEVSVNFDYNIPYIDTKFNIYYKYTGKMPSFSIIDDKVQEYFINDYHMLDFNISKNLLDIFDITFGVKNAFNVKDILSAPAQSEGTQAPSSTFPVGWGRSYFVNLKIKVL
jgi:outer membrane receptor for ferrienterochelin and colicins